MGSRYQCFLGKSVLQEVLLQVYIESPGMSFDHASKIRTSMIIPYI